MCIRDRDLFTSEIVGYAMGERLTRNLVNQSLLQAVTTRRGRRKVYCTTPTEAANTAAMSIRDC